MTHTRSVKHIVTLGVALFVLLGYNHLNAQWTNPPASPPNNNVPAPIHTGIQNQVKEGNFEARLLKITHTVPSLYLDDSDEANDSRIVINNGIFYIQRYTGTAWWADMRLHADDPADTNSYYAWFRNQVRANSYCDQNGLNCLTSGGSVAGDIRLHTINVETNGRTLVAHQACVNAGYDGLWAGMDTGTSEDIICFESDSVVTGLPERHTFVTAFAALKSDPAFRAWWGPGVALPGGGYQNDQGWDVRGSSARQNRTYDKICSYLMVNGRYAPGSRVWADYGSDNNNAAYYWTGSAWGIEGHGDNGAIDVVRMDCQGDGVSTQGDWWLLSNRPEATCYRWRCNPYPAPPMR